MNAKKAKPSNRSTDSVNPPSKEPVDAAQETTEAGPDAAPETKPDDAAQLQEKLLRLQADFDNFRKRTQRERMTLSLSAREELMGEILTLLDHFELGLNNAKAHDANPLVLEGFQLVYDQVVTAMGKFGLAAIDAEGKTFDPHLHEAVTHVASADHPADTIVAQTRRGYTLGEKLLRAAQVVVSSGPGNEQDEEEQDHGPHEA